MSALYPSLLPDCVFSLISSGRESRLCAACGKTFDVHLCLDEFNYITATLGRLHMKGAGGWKEDMTAFAGGF